MAWETYNPQTGKTTYAAAPPAGSLSAAQQATYNEGQTAQAKVNANNYNIMQSAGATPQQTLAAMGGTNGATTVAGLNTQQNALLAPELTKYNAGIMSQPNVVKAVDTAITSAMPSAVLGGKTQSAIMPELKAKNETLAMDAFNKNYVQGQVGLPPKIVQPTGQEGYLKMRDIGAEQKGISLFEQTQGRKPTTSKDWALINNAIYGQSTPPLRGGTLPGAKGDGGVTDHVPPPEVQAEDGTIDQAKLMTTAEQELAQTKNDLEAAQAESDSYNQATEAGGQAIGQQLGVVAPLLQGEALALDQQRALGAKTLEIKIARLEQKKQGLKEEVAQYRQDQQQAFVNFMNLATKTGLSSKSATPEMMKAFETQSKLTGIPASMYMQSLDAIYQSRIAGEALESQKVSADLAQTKFSQTVALANLQLNRDQFSSDKEFKEAQLLLDKLKLNEVKDLTLAEKLKLKEGGYTLDSQGNPVKTTGSESEVQNARDLISTIDGLLGPNSELDSAVGGLDQFKPDSMIGNFKAEFDQLQAKLAFANLDKLKGPMSDKDIQFLKDSSAGLNRSMSEGAFRTKLEKIKERFNVILLKPGELQKNSKAGDGTYSYRNLDGTVHTGKEGDKYIDKTLPPDLDLSGLGFSKVGGDTYKATSYLSNYGPITGEGSKLWKWGLDVDLKKGDPVFSPAEGTVVFSGDSKGFGNRVGIKTAQGNIIYLSHNDALGVKVGDKVTKGQVVALGGNSGSTYSTNGDGSHLDITVKRPDGKYYTPQEIRKILA